jgi:peptidoglycan/xylan/chitin deacetylase (PgdA/CDA1 family)
MAALFTCSIDDGDPADLRMAELLDRHGIAATFYIPVRNREGHKVLPGPALRQLDQGFELGSHTLDHCFLKSLPAEQAHHQIVEGKRQLEDMLGHGVDGFCYPGGKFGERDLQMVKSAGFQYARTTANLHSGPGQNAWRMPTTCQFYPHPRAVFLRNFASQGEWGERGELLGLAMRHEHWLQRIHAMFDHVCANDGVFHLWTHSRDIDQLDAWEQLSSFLAHVAQRLPPTQRLENGKLAQMAY